MWMMDGVGKGGRGGIWANHMGGDFDMFGPMSLITVSIFSVLFLLALLWTIAIKGYALWTAAKRNEKWWFIALLIINTFGILEVVYLIFFAKVWPKKDGNKGVDDHKHDHPAQAHTAQAGAATNGAEHKTGETAHQ